MTEQPTLNRRLVYRCLDRLGPDRVARGMRAFEHQPFNAYWVERHPDPDNNTEREHAALTESGRPSCGCFAGEIHEGIPDGIWEDIVDGVSIPKTEVNEVFQHGYEDNWLDLQLMICDWSNLRFPWVEGA